jgi:ATP-dependent Zn protease
MIHAGSDKKTSGKISNVKLKEKIKNDLQTTRLDVQVNQKLPAQTEEKPIPKPVIRQEDKIKSSMSTRRKPKSFQYKTVEVSWEEPENAPNVWFIAASLLLTFFVLLIFLLAMYLK